jgi:hypothetical protein
MCCARDAGGGVKEVVMRRFFAVVGLGVAMLSLGGCFGDREHDPHYLPYQVWPGNSPGVYQYSTNPYLAPDAPTLGGPGYGSRP